MSCTHKPEAAPTARQVANLVQGVTARFTERPRGPDRGVRRNSVDENQPDAQPWERNKFESVSTGIVTLEALMKVAKELLREGYEKFPRKRICELKERRAGLAGELHELLQRSPADVPTGAPAKVRMELGKVDALLEEADLRLRDTDLLVLQGLLDHLPLTTGRLFPSHEAIGEAATRGRNAVGRSLNRIRHHGFINWIRRSRVKTENEGVDFH